MTIKQEPPKLWMVARSMARAEKQLCLHCQKHGIPTYLPLRRSVKRYQNRVRVHMVPMFPGYVFLQVEPIHKGIVEQSRHAACVIVPDQNMEVLLVQELNGLQILEQATAEGEVEVRPEIAVGKSVLITTGPFAGMHGIVARRKQQTRLSINIELIGQSVSIELDVGEVDVDV